MGEKNGPRDRATEGTSAGASKRGAVPLLGCDAFLLALDGVMRRSGQGPQLSQTVLELETLPDIFALERAWRSFTASHPIVSARHGRNWKGLPVWRLPATSDPRHTPMGRWHEPDSPGQLANAQPVESLETLCLMQRDQRRGARPSPFLLRIDVLERSQDDGVGGAAVIITWSHLVVDGKGVELLLAELARLSSAAAATGAARPNPGPQSPGEAAAVNAMGVGEAQPESSLRQMIDRSRAFTHHFYKLAATPFRSLSGGRPIPGRVFCRVVTLDRQATAKVHARAEQLSSQLINTPFYLAAAAVAHGQIFTSRGQDAGPQIITLPVQTRSRGGRRPIFQNHVTILFFNIANDDLIDTPTATAAIQRQFVEMMRKRLDRSSSVMLDLMRWLPPRLYALFLRKQMRGEITSFYHSHTGSFAPDSTTFAAARVHNAWHIPAASSPPGTGLFLGEHAGRLNLSLSWREGAVTDAERDTLMRCFIEALLGESVESTRTLSEQALTTRLKQ